MFNRKTVFVVGAGASMELNFPSGDTLKKSILALARELAKRDSNNEALLVVGAAREVLGVEAEEISKLASKICLGLKHSPSIDTYLDTRVDDKKLVELGRFLIAYEILKAERDSHIYDFPNKKPVISDKALESWLRRFFELVSTGLRRKNASNAFENIGIINFNYDRSVQQYLHIALQENLDIASDRAAEIVANLDIVHPYGRLGVLPWELPADDSKRTPYGSELRDQIQISQGIFTFAEQRHLQTETIERARMMVASAYRLVFLGFAFHPLNMELLFDSRPSEVIKTMGTSYGLHGEFISHSLDFLRTRNVGTGFAPVLLSSKCADFFAQVQSILSS